MGTETWAGHSEELERGYKPNRIHLLIPWANLEIGRGITDAVAPATQDFEWDVTPD